MFFHKFKKTNDEIKKLPNLIESKKIKITAKKVIIIEIHVFLSGGSFKNIAPSIADSIGAVAIMTRVFATLVFCIETTNVIFVILNVPM